MELGDLLPLASRWLHVLSAMVLVGGTLFLRFTVVPAKKDGALQDETFEFVRTRWSRLVMIAILFSLVCGLYNAAIKAIGFQLDGVYLTLLMLKILVGFFVYFMISVLSGRSAMANRFRESEVKWYNVTCVALVLLVLMAGYMKMSPQPVKIKDDAAAALIEIDA